MVWKQRIYAGNVTVTIQTARWLLLVGIIDKIKITTDNSIKQVWNRLRVDTMIEFTIYSPIPDTGSVEIRFNGELGINYPFHYAHSHCVSSILIGSALVT